MMVMHLISHSCLVMFGSTSDDWSVFILLPSFITYLHKSSKEMLLSLQILEGIGSSVGLMCQMLLPISYEGEKET